VVTGRRTVAALTVLLALSCTTTSVVPPAAPEPARPATTTGPLADAARDAASRHGPDREGYAMLERNRESFQVRLALTDLATDSIDLQTFIWHDDASGRLMIDRLLAAADRGVRVRVLVDDFQLGDDHDIPALNVHPNFEVRIFNPWRHRGGLLTGLLEGAAHARELNQRMHNKLMVADGHAAIVGGRNVADEYFGLAERFNFSDLDLLAVGSIAELVSESFDEYWNDALAHRVEGETGTEDGLRRSREELAAELAEDAPRLVSFEASANAQALRESLLGLHAGEGRVVWDTPSKQTPREDREVVNIIDDVADFAADAKHDLLIASAYFIPHDGGVEELGAIVDRGVRVRVQTNSLGSNDEIVTNSAYQRYRRPVLEAGIELYELRHDAAYKPEFETPPVEGGYLGHHTKAFVADRRTVFVGSLNLDPRAVDINSEMGLIIESESLAGAVADWLERGLGPDNSWRVELDEKGKLSWHSSAGVVQRQPAKTLGERIGDGFYRMLPLESQL